MITTLIHSLPLLISAIAVLGTCAIAFKDYNQPAKSLGVPERVGTTRSTCSARSTRSASGLPLAA